MQEVFNGAKFPFCQHLTFSPLSNSYVKPLSDTRKPRHRPGSSSTQKKIVPVPWASTQNKDKTKDLATWTTGKNQST